MSFSKTSTRLNSKICTFESTISDQESIRIDNGFDDSESLQERRNNGETHLFLKVKLPSLPPYKTVLIRSSFIFRITGQLESLGYNNATIENGEGKIVAYSDEFEVVSRRQHVSIEFYPKTDESYFLTCKVEHAENWATFYFDNIETKCLLLGCKDHYILKQIYPDNIDWDRVADSLSCDELPLQQKRKFIQNTIDDYGNNLIHLACIQNAPIRIYKSILSIGGRESVFIRNDLGHTPLHSVCINCTGEDYVKALIKVGGIDIIEARDENDCTALQLAHWKGHETIISLLQSVVDR